MNALEIFAQELRFILNHTFDDQGVSIRDLDRLCGPSLSKPLAEYLNFLEQYAYVARKSSGRNVQATQRGIAAVSSSDSDLMLADIESYVGGNVPASQSRAQGDRLSSDRLSSDQISSDEILMRVKEPAVVMSSDDSNQLDGRYEKGEIVGEGGIGTVYRATQLLLSRDVALKELRAIFDFFTSSQRPEIKRRFDEVVRAAGRLVHPNIVMTFDANTTRNFPYVVTDLVDSGNLRTRIEHMEDAPIPVGVSVSWVVQMLQALEYAHGRGVVHCGLKPENLLLDKQENIRISDFGIVRVAEQDDANIRQVYMGMGQLGYMAPEVLKSSKNASPSSDLYAVGIILYELLTGRLPGRRSAMPSEIHPELPQEIDDIFDRLTQDEVSNRYSAAKDVLSDLYASDYVRPIVASGQHTLYYRTP